VSSRPRWSRAGRATGQDQPAGATSLARLLRAGELTTVWVPDETHEAVRDLVRTRAMAIEDYRRKRQHVSSFLLRHGRSYEGSPTWKGLHLRWLDRQAFAHPAQRRAFQELLNAVRAAVERIGRLEAALLEVVPAWTMGSGSVSSRAKPDDGRRVPPTRAGISAPRPPTHATR
jgi:transposase